MLFLLNEFFLISTPSAPPQEKLKAGRYLNDCAYLQLMQNRSALLEKVFVY